MRYISFLLVFVAMAIAGCGTPPITINFDNLSSVTFSGAPISPGDIFKVGDVLTEGGSGIQMVVVPFQWGNGTWTDQGEVEIIPGNKAGGSVNGNEVHFNNACLGIIAPPSNQDIQRIAVKFADYGGNINLIERGSGTGNVHNHENFAAIPSPTPGSGLNVTVAATTTTSFIQGVLTLSGNIMKFDYTFPVPGVPVRQYAAVLGGGQELWIDDLEFSY